ncbi:RBBP9/YdeN family alpha/beta hydrolase [Kribbella sp. NPDC056951]|uniref:RBBP9/YdeN family alpha/beta hydrolase n=1 Tax=Kribbella sp. NPDC056951 TaxID=3345978 RepID=UPI00362A9FE5
MHYIIVPGWNGSDSDHWQSIWEADWLPGATRIEVASWTHPERDDWVDAIERAVRASDDEVVLVAHSLGCYAVTHWLAAAADRAQVRGAFLVAPPDQSAEAYPTELLSTFEDAGTAVSIPAVVVTSDNDPYCTLDAAARIAGDWQIPLVATGELGHINSESKLEDWVLGQRLLTSFVAGLGRQALRSR